MPNLFRKRKSPKSKGEQIHLLTIAKEAHGTTDRFHADVHLNEVLISTPNSQASGKGGADALNKYRKKEDVQKPKGTGRRPSVEERTMKDAYHAGLVDGGVVILSDDEVAEVQGPESSKLPGDGSSNTRAEAQPSSTSSSEPKPQVLNILCGRQNRESPYFTRRLEIVSGSLLDTTAWPRPSAFCERSHIDPDASELCTLWQHIGTIPAQYYDFDLSDVDSEHIWLAYWPLMNAAIHGYTLRDVYFTDLVMDLLRENLPENVRPDLATIAHLFWEHIDDTPDVLRQLIVDRWVDAGLEESYDQVNFSQKLPFFANAVLKTALQRLSDGKRCSSQSGCVYHSHILPEDCYKHSTTQDTVETEDQSKGCQDISYKTLESKAAKSRNKGINDADPAKLKAEAHQAMRDQRGLSWVGFRRLDKQKTEAQGLLSFEDSSLLSGVIPECPDTPEAHDQTVSPASTLFGTTQTDRSVNDVRIEPPTREAPPPPSLFPAPFAPELQDGPTTLSHEALPAYVDEAYMPFCNNRPSVIGQADGSYSLPLHVNGAQSAPTSEPKANPKMDTRAGKHITCPGAFPESRPGSLRSVTRGQSSSLDAV
jgi:hypothetical protein